MYLCATGATGSPKYCWLQKLYKLRLNVCFKQQFDDIKNDFFFFKRGPKFYVLNHLADLARRRLRRKLLSIQPRKIIDKNCTIFQSRVTVVKK